MHTGYRGRSGRDGRDQGSAHHGGDRRRARAVADNRALQCRIRLRKQHYQAHRIEQFDRDRAVILRSVGVDSGEDSVEPITIDRGGRHIGEVFAAAMRTVRREIAEDANLFA